MAIEPQQASHMSKMDGARLPSTPRLFWNRIYLLQVGKNDDEEHCFLKNLALVENSFLKTRYT